MVTTEHEHCKTAADARWITMSSVHALALQPDAIEVKWFSRHRCVDKILSELNVHQSITRLRYYLPFYYCTSMFMQPSLHACIASAAEARQLLQLVTSASAMLSVLCKQLQQVRGCRPSAHMKLLFSSLARQMQRRCRRQNRLLDLQQIGWTNLLDKLTYTACSPRAEGDMHLQPFSDGL